MEENQEEVFRGIKTVSGGAFWTKERSEKYLISDSYRYEWNSFYLHKEEKILSRITNIDSLLKNIKAKNMKLGVVSGYRYTSNKVNDFIDKYEGKHGVIVESSNEEMNFDQLVKNKIDIIIADRITGAQIIWKNKKHWEADITEHQLQLPEKPIHLLMHKGRNPEENAKNLKLLNNFNKSLKELKQKGSLRKLIANYLFPVLINITVETKWFALVDYIGAIFFALAGFLMARESRFDIFGTLVMVALLTSGGGIMRDILVGKIPAFLKDATYIYIILYVAFIGFILSKIHAAFIKKYPFYYLFVKKCNPYTVVLRVFIEAIALGAYTIIGVGVAVEMEFAPLWLWGPLFGVLTSCGGGVLVSCLKNNKEKGALQGSLDPEVSIIGGIGFSIFLLWQIDRLNPEEVFIGVIVTITFIAILLYILLLFKKTSPSLQLDKDIIENYENKQ